VKRESGLTLIEVIIALAILSIALGGLTALLLTSMKQDLSSGKRTQAAQILNYLGRQQVGGDPRLRTTPDRPLLWNYGQLSEAFPELEHIGGIGDPDLYKVKVRNLGTPPEILEVGVDLDAYEIFVCWRTGAEENCLKGETLAPSPAGGGPTPPLPLIN